MAPGVAADPYKVWLSEVMLQQTVVRTVIPYFNAFVARWPTVEALAASPLDEVLSRWAGLGYYRRARNLHACAQAVVRDHGGAFPADEVALRALPGIGAYTAAAITAIAFERRAVVVDGNVERVMARYFNVEDPLPGAKATLKAHADVLTPEARPGDYAQAVMDLGATVCSPKSPACGICPLMQACAGRLAGHAATLPRKAVKRPKPHRAGQAYVVVRADGAVLLRQRPPEGLLGGMMEVPGSDWVETDEPKAAPRRAMAEEASAEEAPVKAPWTVTPVPVSHVFTHFTLTLEVYTARVRNSARLTAAAQPERCRWVARDALATQALPSVMRKVLAAAGLG